MSRPLFTSPVCSLRQMLAATALALAFGAPALAAPEDPLPFVDAQGLVTRTVRYSDVIKALGEPPASRVTPESRTNGRIGGGDFEFSYPQRGLSFLIDRQERPQRDPEISSMTVKPPAWGETPQGLRVGQRRDEALKLLGRHYQEQHRYDQAGEVSSLVVRDAQGRSPRTLWVAFEQGAVSFMRFDTQDPPVLSSSTRKFLGETVLFGVLLALGLGWVKLREKLGLRPIPDDDETPRRLGLGWTLLILGFLLVGGLIFAQVVSAFL